MYVRGIIGPNILPAVIRDRLPCEGEGLASGLCNRSLSGSVIVRIEYSIFPALDSADICGVAASRSPGLDGGSRASEIKKEKVFFLYLSPFDLVILLPLPPS